MAAAPSIRFECLRQTLTPAKHSDAVFWFAASLKRKVALLFGPESGAGWPATARTLCEFASGNSIHVRHAYPCGGMAAWNYAARSAESPAAFAGKPSGRKMPGRERGV